MEWTNSNFQMDKFQLRTMEWTNSKVGAGHTGCPPSGGWFLTCCQWWSDGVGGLGRVAPLPADFQEALQVVGLDCPHDLLDLPSARPPSPAPAALPS